MKAGIISINLHTRKLNYGAVLHSWYFQKLMQRRSDIKKCDVIDYISPEMEKEDVRRRYLDEIKKNYKYIPFILPMYRAFSKRFDKFERFFREHMTVTANKYTHKVFEGEKLPYDVLFFESDVIWSPHYFKDSFDPAYFGAFPAMDGIYKIAYSASMGNAELDNVRTEELRGLLKSPDSISMRETYASRIIRGLTDKPVEDVVDPVLLAEPEDFDEITAPRMIKQDYVLVYFPIKPNKYTRECAKAYAKAHNLKVVEVSDRVYDVIYNKTIASAGIEEFVSLVRNAKAVFCNSLHGVCLSLVFHKEFYACHRESGMKYKDLCCKFGLEDRYVTHGKYRELEPIDWDKVENIRKKYRAQSLAWLDEQLRIASGTLKR